MEAVFARGSGQDPGAREAVRFQTQLKERVPLSNFYELGKESIDGQSYPAIAVGGDSPDHIWNSFTAWATAGGGLSYGNSVNEGVNELDSYITKRAQTCPEAVFVVGGYSQGAQVVGETYNEKLSDPLRGRVFYQALFGDPRLYLPEGEGDEDADACTGGASTYSAWRFDVPGCQVDRGSLGSRKPYLPANFTLTTGLSCANDDFVCGSTGDFNNSPGHHTYANEGLSIDRTVAEIARRLAIRFPDAGIDAEVDYPGQGTAGLDVAFLIDSTGSMSSQIAAAKAFAAEMAGSIGAVRGRVALVEYRDEGDAFTARILSGLQEDTTEFNAKLATITASGGGDTPEAALHALMTAFDGLQWRDGATKAAVILTDAGYHDPDKVDGSTLAAVAQRSLEIDPVNVYPVVPYYSSGFYTALAEATSGQVIVNTGDTKAALTTALTRLQTRPVALLKHPHYYAKAGQQVTFDASASYSPGSTISSYKWDYDGEGTFEETTAGPVATHTYSANFDGVMQVRVTDANGTLSNASAFIHIGSSPDDGVLPTPLNLVATPISEINGFSTVRITWASDGPNPDRWGLSADGIPAGTAAGNAITMEMRDVPRDRDFEIGVAGITAGNIVGKTATVIVPASTGGPSPYTFSGFKVPVDAAPSVNVMAAGRSVPVRFSLGGDFGLSVLAAGSPTSVPVTCETNAPLDEVETTTTAGASSLTYSQGDGTYGYVWKTDSTWAGSCRIFQLTLNDGTTHQALFKFRT